ncbi:hypothetical protein K7X08_004900 [Anisodus acutangulus]|uniref:t-SNARE coiled-coil homology domain-containing protein n=2 Tax=Solanoideae TaxID=424551 RepID=A0A9Q1RIL0_9SOLA|nr:hypothetical protein K7X08_004900 [Anisodus acutangulus]
MAYSSVLLILPVSKSNLYSVSTFLPLKKYCVDCCRFQIDLQFPLAMNSRRERSNRAALFDGIEEGGIRASSSYASHEIDEQENEKAMDGLQDRVLLLKRLSGDIHEEVDTHNRMLDRMGNDMDSSRGVLSGTMDKFKMVFETKSSRRMFTLVASFVVLFLVVYYLTR